MDLQKALLGAERRLDVLGHCHEYAQRTKNKNKLKYPLDFWRLFLEGQMPVPRIRGSMISGWESKTSEIYSIVCSREDMAAYKKVEKEVKNSVKHAKKSLEKN